MAAKRHPVDAEDVVRRYVAGESAPEIGRSLCVSDETVTRIVRNSGTSLRTRSERVALQWAKRMWVPPDDLVARYLAGESEVDLSKAYGVSRGPITRCLLEAGVTRRGIAEANIINSSRKTPEQHRLYAQAAHEAVRGKPLSEEHRVKIAKSRQRTLPNVSEYERLMTGWLTNRDIACVPQQAIGPYNADIGAAPVAVEIFGGNWHGSGRHSARASKRARYVLDAGWNLVVIWCGKSSPLDERAADQVVAFYERSRRDPTFRGEHRVIWGGGEVVPTRRGDFDEIAHVPPLSGSFDMRC